MAKPKRGTDVSEFLRGLDRVDAAVGRGTLTLSITVDQRYAKKQHQDPTLRHPEGGKAFYLRDPLFELAPQMVEEMADRAITRDGSDLRGAAVDMVQVWAHAVRLESPHWWGDLANSGHPVVTDDDTVVYERQPKARRLTDEEIRLKNRWRIHPSRRRRRRR